jgi:alkaline phosphatase D
VANAAPGSPESAHIAGSRAVEAATLAGNRHVQFMEWVEHGYGIVQLDKEKALFEFWWQDKLLPSAQSVDVLGYQMVSWAKSGGTANDVPKFANQIDFAKSRIHYLVFGYNSMGSKWCGSSSV